MDDRIVRNRMLVPIRTRMRNAQKEQRSVNALFLAPASVREELLANTGWSAIFLAPGSVSQELFTNTGWMAIFLAPGSVSPEFLAKARWGGISSP